MFKRPADFTDESWRKVRTYQFEKDGTNLVMILGVYLQSYPEKVIMGYSFRGLNIPFPVAAGTWMMGINPDDMVVWFKNHDWELVCETNLSTNKTRVYSHPLAMEKKRMDRPVIQLMDAGHSMSAANLSRCNLGCGLVDANNYNRNLYETEKEAVKIEE